MGRPSTARQRLLDTACREFARVGAQAIGVDELCRLAGINKGSFYHFFPSKTDLLLSCLEVSWEHLRADVFEPAFAPDLSPKERIGAFFDRIVNAQETQKTSYGEYFGCLFCSLGNEIGTQIPEVRDAVTDFMDRNLAYLSHAFAEAEDSHRLAFPPKFLAENTYTLLLGALVEVKLRQNLAPLLRSKAAALAFIQENT